MCSEYEFQMSALYIKYNLPSGMLEPVHTDSQELTVKFLGTAQAVTKN